MHYTYLITLQGGVTTHTQTSTVLGHKFADLREAKVKQSMLTAGNIREKKWTKTQETELVQLE